MRKFALALVAAVMLTAGAAMAATVNINTATPEQLQQLPGIGPAKAQAIADYRTQHGPFQSASDLKNVPGIGAPTLANIQKQNTLTTKGPNAPSSTTSASAASPASGSAISSASNGVSAPTAPNAPSAPALASAPNASSAPAAQPAPAMAAAPSATAPATAPMPASAMSSNSKMPADSTMAPAAPAATK